MSTGSNVAICWVVPSDVSVIGLASDGRESVCACAYVLSVEHSRRVRRKGPGFRKPSISATSLIVDVHAGSLTGGRLRRRVESWLIDCEFHNHPSVLSKDHPRII